MNRSTLIMSPAKVTTAYPGGTSVSFFTKSNFEVQRVRDTVRIGSQAAGDEERESDLMHRASIVPEGRWSAAIIAALWPHLNKTPGTMLFGDTDRSLVMTGTDGVTQTLVAAAVTKMPNIKFSSVESLVGAVEYTGLLANNADWDDANNRETAGTGGTFVDSSYANSLIKTQSYKGNLGAITGFTDIETVDGFDVVFNLRTVPVKTNRLGTYNYAFAGLDMAVNFIPASIGSADIIAAAGMTGNLRGAALRARSAGTAQFTIVGDDAVTYLTIPSATVKSTATRWGVGDSYTREGEISVVANWTFSSGAQVALCTLAAS